MPMSMQRLDEIELDPTPSISSPFLPQKGSNSHKSSTKWRESYQPTLRSCGEAFQEAYHDLKSAKWYGISLGCLILIWIPGLMALVVGLALISAGKLSIDDSACRPDGDFSPIRDSFKWWAPKGFFQITIRMGKFDFAKAKLIDVAWDLLVGRGGQPILAILSWRAFSDYLAISIATKPATYTTVWLLRFHTDVSAVSVLRLMHQFKSTRGLASRSAMTFMIGTALFILAFPTFAGSMTGYTTSNRAYVDTVDNLSPFDNAFPVAYVIHDGDRVGLEENYHVPFINKTIGGEPLLGSDYLPPTLCENWRLGEVAESCSLQWAVSQYVQRYGFSSDRDKKEEALDETTWNDTFTIEGGPLQVSAFYIPDDLEFYYNWTITYPRETDPNVTSKASNEDLGDKYALTYDVDGKLYNLKQLEKVGVCQPIQDGYQWGFSFLQLCVMTILLLLWSIGIAIMATNAHWTLRFNEIPPTTGSWKALIEFTEGMEKELKGAGIDHTTLSDDQLNDEIESVLEGGSVSSARPFEKGLYSLRTHGLPCAERQWVSRNKWWYLGLICWYPICAVQLILEVDSPVFAVVYGLYLVLLAVVILYKKELTPARKIFWILFTCVAAFFSYLFLFLPYIVPGTFIGVVLATSAGSTRRSRAIWFGLPFACNLIIGLVCGLLYQRVGCYWLFGEQ